MVDPVEQVRVAIYRRFATTGRRPTRGAMARATGLSRQLVDSAFETLAAGRHIVLDDDGEVIMAHPFAAANFGFSVMGKNTLWWGGCAWDAFAIPHLIDEEPSVLIATTCPACETPMAWTVTRDYPPIETQVAHFLTPVAHIWDDVVSACGNQRIFCDERCVDRWLERTGRTRGSVFDLPTLWRLAERWYEGRLSSPYRRRDPAEASDYFGRVGLRGSFWGLGAA